MGTFFSRRTKRTVGRAAAVALVVGSVGALSAAPASAATQNGCSWSVPKPSVVDGKANFKLVVTCTTTMKFGTTPMREVVLDLVGDDVSFDDTIKWGWKEIPNSGTYTFDIKGWPCNEDAIGNDEIYVRVHTGTRTAAQIGAAATQGGLKPGQGYKMAAWTVGATASGACR